MDSKLIWMVRIAGGLVSVLLQVAVAPFISLGQFTPNFIAAWCIACTMTDPANPPYFSAFALGLAFDAVGGGPVGAMAFCLLVVTFASSRVFMVLSNDTVFMTVALIFAASLAVEVLYGAVLCAVQPAFSWGTALLYRSLPLSLYNFVVAVVVYPIVAFLRLKFAASSVEMPII